MVGSVGVRVLGYGVCLLLYWGGGCLGVEMGCVVIGVGDVGVL